MVLAQRCGRARNAGEGESTCGWALEEEAKRVLVWEKGKGVMGAGSEPLHERGRRVRLEYLELMCG